MNERKVAWVLAMAVAVAGVRAEPAAKGPEAGGPREERAYLIDPGLPRDLDGKLAWSLLNELVTALEMVPGVHAVKPTQATMTMVVRSSIGSEEPTRMVQDLRTRILADLEGARRRLQRSAPPMEREDLVLATRFVVASRKPGPTGSLPAPVEARLAGLFGFKSFRDAGVTLVEGSVGSEAETKASLPWEGAHLQIHQAFGPHRAEDGRLMVGARFEVYRKAPGPEGKEQSTEVKATYRPKKGTPTVVGASPLSADESLVILIEHSGSAIE